MAFNFKKLFSLASPPAYQTGQLAGPKRYIPGAANYGITEDTAMTVSAFNRGVIYISTQIAKLPWDVKDIKNEIKGGTVSNLLGLAPNPEMTAFMWRSTMIQNALIHGNAYSEIQRDIIGRPIALWPIPSQSVDLVRGPDGRLIYRVTSQQGGPASMLDPNDIFHLRNFHTKDGLVGQGIVAYASQTLGIASAADRMASGIFSNGGLPSGVLTTEGKMSDEAYNRLKTSWKEQHSGAKAGGVAILEEGVEFAPIQMAPELLQFLDSRKFGIVEAARFLGLPPSKLFESTSRSYSNVENSNLEVATDTLDAWANNLETEADVKLLNSRYGGAYTELDLYSVFRGDMAARGEYFSKRMQMGTITPNEVRALEGQAPYPDGDRFYIAVNNFTPADRVDEVIDAQVANKNPAVMPSAGSKDVTPAKEDPKQIDPGKQAALTDAVISFLKK